MNLLDELKKIQSYINRNYDVPNELINSLIKCENESSKCILVKTTKYDLEILLGIPEDNHFLKGISDFYISLDYNANKKYRTELGYRGGGYHEKYNPNDYSNIDVFIQKFCNKREYEQISIFDIEREIQNEI